MGDPICRHLATKSGILFIANDRNTETLQRLAGLGVNSATIEEMSQQADLIFMSLPSGEIVRNVVEGNGGNGLLQLCRSGQIVVDLSTSPVDLTRAIADRKSTRLNSSH